MAHDETASTSKWAKSEQSLGGQQQLKKNPLQVKRKLPSVSADSVQEQHSAARVLVCLHAHPREKKGARNPSKLLTQRSAFIHDVSYPLPMPRHGSSGALRREAVNRAGEPQNDGHRPSLALWLCTTRRAIKEPAPLCPINREENEVGTGLNVRLLPNISVEPIPGKPCNIQVTLQKIWPPGGTRAVYTFQPL